MRETDLHAKTSAYQNFMDMLDDLLQQLSPINSVTITDDLWIFTDREKKISINFNHFNLPYTEFVREVSLSSKSDLIRVTTKEFAKLLWLSQHEDKVTYQSSIKILDVLSLLFSYLANKQITYIAESELEDFFTYLLSYNLNQEGLNLRFYPPAYRTRLHFLNIKLLLQTLKIYGCPSLLPRLHYNKYKDAINNSCLNVLGITFSDYQKGGSFNFLGLDTGRHYIDFCSQTFEEQISYATACRLTMSEMSTEVSRQMGYKYTDVIQLVCSEILMGIPSNEIRGREIKKTSLPTLKGIVEIVHCLFFKHYYAVIQQNNAFKLDTINSIIVKLGLPENRFDNQEFVRSMLFARYYGKNGKSRLNIIKEFIASLRSTHPKLKPQWSESDFNGIVDSVTQTTPIDINSVVSFFKEHHSMCDKLQRFNKITHTIGVRKLERALMNVESAGVTLFVALTGWRATEFGFALNNIHISVNKDVLDSTYTPYQFHVKWIVPKTSKNTPLNREITLSGYLLATQLATLNQSGINKPCLHSAMKKASINKVITNRVSRIWQGFIDYYSLFEELDELEKLIVLQKDTTLSNHQQSELVKLSKNHNLQQSQTQALQGLRDQLREELPCYLLANQVNQQSFGKKLKGYREGSLKTEERALLEKYLSDDTKMSLKSGITLDQATVKHIKEEFLQRATHPTPHALRHIWAEAVLRRYRGNVGRFIRANFKHLNDDFFMAYLRDKEMSAVYEISQRNVINDIVRQHLLALKDDQRNYTGGFDSYLNKVVNITNIASNEDYIKMSQKISDRIGSIKPNPWVTCLLRSGTEERAKCSQNGIPQRRNASPKLCLGCINADITEGNYIGIVVYTSIDVAACRNPELPAFIKIQHLPVLQLAISQIKKLRNNSQDEKYNKFINHLQESIDIAQKTIDGAK
ncbi:hypothetical protein Ping_0153 [Psychromonas ingrahamii 37]|uniref:Uncharacterized protein n=1 Tax=Psychromonas ingrahamii (strain DSM 17664 / CCUG 51855 / 37) TaxID=357804 RepID=A1SRA6_PSYIN|nr:hypothetical protein [Psychromonas ingrahamii]ABM02021.1 hypothetical protein Ping_0153 [Psychromonas ingrahamii 37]